MHIPTTTPAVPVRYASKWGLWLVLMLVATLSDNAWADHQVDPALEPLIRRALAEGECFEDRFDREVWFTAMEPKLKRLVKDPDERREILEHVQCEAKRQRLPAPLVMAVIDVESQFNRWAVSSAGAVGLMQVMPFWPRKLGMENSQLVKIPHNIHIGCTILKYYLERENGNYTKALARYNGSTGRRNYSDKVLIRLSDRWRFK
ncbi:MAG TPA: lytic transglycosylase domain-containing protein [Steroidobacteraceae bacterium]|jgi:soluble lytic murein transglycosylase-like protein|nr:lytic transglycosylase domain-containing protein [Steroidobacteraceae bacterium]